MADKANVVKVENGRLIIDVALDGTQLSSSGKSIVKFSTRGNVKLEEGVTVGVNAYVRA